MSTASDTPRIPALASRTSIHSGVAAAGSSPWTSLSTNLSHAAGSPMLAGYTSADSAVTSPGSPASAGAVYGTSNEVASSRATPRIDSAQPMVGVTAMASTWAARPAQD